MPSSKVRSFCAALQNISSSDLETPNRQGTRGKASPRAPLSSMSEAAWGPSHWYSLVMSRTFASLSRTVNLSWGVQSRYVHCIHRLTNSEDICLITYGRQFWKKNMPDALGSGRVKLQGSLNSASTFTAPHIDV